MAFILNIETATKNCSVAVAKDGVTIALKEFAGEGYAHAEKLHVFIEEVLQQSNIQFSDLNAVAISMGPGSYTGLRIGVSAAKGFCYALNLPLIAVDTLELLARKISVENGAIIPMIDARRMEAYTAVFDAGYNKVRETKAEIITEGFYDDISGAIHLVGDGAAKYNEVLPAGKFVYHDDVIYPSAAQMGLLSYNKFTQDVFEDVAYFEPYYLKDFIVGK
ncbi:tRNA (adenosine(37)-N6)-threonylcarbamoyltransferase complex dimerization subunit type 1 TsaB [Flavobacterium sp. Sd200]|uniref:tRNA (adenosine(37)-N6)-threonylcarbamoyltransferase complex dimerization subunit type 1 TsaB n=1 Tax=Flavobacterium sp. Sd200 TaxID=2692211 RepID=UPI00136958DF|nr:tRNA (adenosine(37)-N6)-threonylcarbamoyltransferase complex dimerization subunit type 1 TsaB [Flavobacterium sp. Sd200]MXN92297.1 tRNA (adenosine(37)-N6)-threonylcarbamoyltransferase complex dimerization subunit type 1 TsaB [Flavobacterium sp. Sd200]